MSIDRLLRSAVPEGLRLELRNRVLHVVFDRPDRRNAIHRGIWDYLPGAVEAAERDDSVRAVSFSGVDAASFSAGADIGEFDEQRIGVENARRYSDAVRAAELAIIGCAKPTVSFVRGWCIGGGCEIAVACDIRIGDETARMGITPAKLGIVYGLTSTSRLVEEVGPAWARYLLFTAEILDAETALRAGLLQYVYPSDEAESRWERLLERLTSGAPITQSGAKQLVARSVRGESDEDATAAALYDASYLSEEYRIGVDAFLNKRRPDFDGVGWPDPS